MPRALPVALRQTIIERHRAGVSLPAIAQECGLSPWTVRTLWRRYRDRGEAGLVPDYAACGRRGPRPPSRSTRTPWPCAGRTRAGAPGRSAPSWPSSIPTTRCPMRRRCGAGSARRSWRAHGGRHAPPIRHAPGSRTSAGNWMPPSR